MCPICWINGLIALLIGMGLLAIDSPYTPWLIGLAVVLSVYALWRFYAGYKRLKGFTPEQRAKNWKTIIRFSQGIFTGAAIAAILFFYVYWEVISEQHHATEHHSCAVHPDMTHAEWLETL